MERDTWQLKFGDGSSRSVTAALLSVTGFTLPCTEKGGKYCKHQYLSCTVLLKISISNWRCSLSGRTSGHHAIYLHKLTPFSENLHSV